MIRDFEQRAEKTPIVARVARTSPPAQHPPDVDEETCRVVAAKEAREKQRRDFERVNKPKPVYTWSSIVAGKERSLADVWDHANPHTNRLRTDNLVAAFDVTKTGAKCYGVVRVPRLADPVWATDQHANEVVFYDRPCWLFADLDQKLDQLTDPTTPVDVALHAMCDDFIKAATHVLHHHLSVDVVGAQCLFGAGRSKPTFDADTKTFIEKYKLSVHAKIVTTHPWRGMYEVGTVMTFLVEHVCAHRDDYPALFTRGGQCIIDLCVYKGAHRCYRLPYNTKASEAWSFNEHHRIVDAGVQPPTIPPRPFTPRPGDSPHLIDHLVNYVDVKGEPAETLAYRLSDEFWEWQKRFAPQAPTAARNASAQCGGGSNATTSHDGELRSTQAQIVGVSASASGVANGAWKTLETITYNDADHAGLPTPPVLLDVEALTPDELLQYIPHSTEGDQGWSYHIYVLACHKKLGGTREGAEEWCQRLPAKPGETEGSRWARSMKRLTRWDELRTDWMKMTGRSLHRLMEKAHPAVFDAKLRAMEAIKDLHDISRYAAHYGFEERRIHQRWMPDDIFDKGISIVVGNCGLGKSYQLRRYQEALCAAKGGGENVRMIQVVPRRTFGRFVHKSTPPCLPSNYYGELVIRGDWDRSRTNLIEAKGLLVIQAESLVRMDDDAYNINCDRRPLDALIIDESESVLALFNSRTMDARRRGAINVLVRAIRKADKVILMDAMPTVRTLAFAKMAQEIRVGMMLPASVGITVNTMNQRREGDAPTKTHFISEENRVAIIEERLRMGEKIFVAYNSKTALELEAKALEARNYNTKILTSDNINLKENQEFVETPSRWTRQGLHYLGVTACVTVGNSCDEEYYDSVFIQSDALTAVPRDNIQTANRIRYTKRHFIAISQPANNKQAAYAISKLRDGLPPYITGMMGVDDAYKRVEAANRLSCLELDATSQPDDPWWYKMIHAANVLETRCARVCPEAQFRVLLEQHFGHVEEYTPTTLPLAKTKTPKTLRVVLGKPFPLCPQELPRYQALYHLDRSVMESTEEGVDALGFLSRVELRLRFNLAAPEQFAVRARNGTPAIFNLWEWMFNLCSHSQLWARRLENLAAELDDDTRSTCARLVHDADMQSNARSEPLLQQRFIMRFCRSVGLANSIDESKVITRAQMEAWVAEITPEIDLYRRAFAIARPKGDHTEAVIKITKTALVEWIGTRVKVCTFRTRANGRKIDRASPDTTYTLKMAEFPIPVEGKEHGERWLQEGGLFPANLTPWCQHFKMPLTWLLSNARYMEALMHARELSHLDNPWHDVEVEDNGDEELRPDFEDDDEPPLKRARLAPSSLSL